jgi:hypothetical protein
MRTVASNLYCLRYDRENAEFFKRQRQFIPKSSRIDAGFLRNYKKRWLPWSSSFFVSKKELEIYCHLGNKQSMDFLPLNIWFTTIDPAINDKQMAWGYAEKGNYRKLYGIDSEPLSFLRYLNGLSFDAIGNLIPDPKSYFEQVLKKHEKILVKPVIDSWGGRNILVFEKNNLGKWNCLNDQVRLSFKHLVAWYQKNFVVQEYLDQHPFYKRFNPSSFNTIRIYVYRSPEDERVHILHTLLKVGRKGNVVDNISAGGLFFYLLPDGSFLHGISKKLETLATVPDGSGMYLKNLPRAPGFEALKELASKIALNTPFHRLLAMDMNIDAEGKPRLIELNLSEAGSGVQLFGMTFFGRFTDEVIEYCKSHKKVDYIRI